MKEQIGSVADHNEELMKVKQGPSAPWSELWFSEKGCICAIFSLTLTLVDVMGGGGHSSHQQQSGGHSHFRGHQQQQSGGHSHYRGHQQQQSGGQSHFRPSWGGV